jgi:TRAP-type C4-dicarboxylate transport system permease small subunit
MSSTEFLQPRSVLATIANGALILAGVALLGMAAIEGWQVFARYVLNDSPSWTEPVALLLMSTTMMLGAAVGVQREAHFGFYIAVESASPRVQAALRFVGRAIIASSGALMAVLGAILARDAWSYPMAGVALPQGVVFLPMCMGGALIVVFAVERMVRPAAPPVSSGE